MQRREEQGWGWIVSYVSSNFFIRGNDSCILEKKIRTNNDHDQNKIM